MEAKNSWGGARCMPSGRRQKTSEYTTSAANEHAETFHLEGTGKKKHHQFNSTQHP